MQQREDILVLDVDKEGQRKRLDAWVATRLGILSRSRIKELIENKKILVNGAPSSPSQKIKLNDKIQVMDYEEKPRVLGPMPIPLHILYEDDSILVLNKQPGLPVHPGPGKNYLRPTLVHGLLHYAAQWSRMSTKDTHLRPGIVHRLDADTSGVMVCAKTDQAHDHLALQFKNKQSKRRYLALLYGAMPMAEMIIESYLGRDPSHRLKMTSVSLLHYKNNQQEFEGKKLRYAKSLFRRLATYGQSLFLAEVELFTGRTHQIRVHAQHLNGFVLGDPLYGQKNCSFEREFGKMVGGEVGHLKRQLLHAASLELIHPITQETMIFRADLPLDFVEILTLLKFGVKKRDMEHHKIT